LRVTIPFAYEIEGEISQNEPVNDGVNENLSDREKIIFSLIKENQKKYCCCFDK